MPSHFRQLPPSRDIIHFRVQSCRLHPSHNSFGHYLGEKDITRTHVFKLHVLSYDVGGGTIILTAFFWRLLSRGLGGDYMEDASIGSVLMYDWHPQ